MCGGWKALCCPGGPHLGAVKGSDCMQDTVRNVDCDRGAMLKVCMFAVAVSFNPRWMDTLDGQSELNRQQRLLGSTSKVMAGEIEPSQRAGERERRD